MRFENLADIESKDAELIKLGNLPGIISITDYAKEKSQVICDYIRHKYRSVEWYGFLIADRNNPELIIDVGLGKNNTNSSGYTNIIPEEIEKFEYKLDKDKIINGWIHSHGSLGLKTFSQTDRDNHRTVLCYVTSGLKRPLYKKEILTDDISLLVKGKYKEDDMKEGCITAITDKKIEDIKLYHGIYGGFSYSIVVGNQGLYDQTIYYKRYSN
ncbi:hypothetical protein ACFL1H_07295, partial [Nanoarchaeota archaeon]